MEIDHAAWTKAVSTYLAGRKLVRTGAVALEALGRSYDAMSVEDWRRLAGIMKALGWRRKRLYGAFLWEAPAHV